MTLEKKNTVRKAILMKSAHESSNVTPRLWLFLSACSTDLHLGPHFMVSFAPFFPFHRCLKNGRLTQMGARSVGLTERVLKNGPMGCACGGVAARVHLFLLESGWMGLRHVFKGGSIESVCWDETPNIWTES